jgi:hypothetical protein
MSSLQRAFSFVSVPVLLGLAFVACGDDGDPTDGPVQDSVSITALAGTLESKMAGVDSGPSSVFLVVQVRFSNDTPGEYTLGSPATFTLETADGATLSADAVTDAHASGCKAGTKIAAATAVECAVAFNVPNGSVATEVSYEADPYQATSPFDCAFCGTQCVPAAQGCNLTFADCSAMCTAMTAIGAQVTCSSMQCNDFCNGTAGLAGCQPATLAYYACAAERPADEWGCDPQFMLPVYNGTSCAPEKQAFTDGCMAPPP